MLHRIHPLLLRNPLCNTSMLALRTLCIVYKAMDEYTAACKRHACNEEAHEGSKAHAALTRFVATHWILEKACSKKSTKDEVWLRDQSMMIQRYMTSQGMEPEALPKPVAAFFSQSKTIG